MRRTPSVRRMHLMTGLLFLFTTCGQSLSAVAGADLRPNYILDTSRHAARRGIAIGGDGHRIRTSPIYAPVDLSANPGQVVGGETLSLSVQMSSVVGVNTTVQLWTAQPGAFSSLPTSVVVPAGSQTATFPVTTNASGSTNTICLSASNRYGSVSTNFVITP